jgi:hypothetical protein
LFSSNWFRKHEGKIKAAHAGGLLFVLTLKASSALEVVAIATIASTTANLVFIFIVLILILFRVEFLVPHLQYGEDLNSDLWDLKINHEFVLQTRCVKLALRRKGLSDAIILSGEIRDQSQAIMECCSSSIVILHSVCSTTGGKVLSSQGSEIMCVWHRQRQYERHSGK